MAVAMATSLSAQLFGSSKSCKHARTTAFATMPPHQDRYEVSLKLVTIAGTEYAMQADLSHNEDVAELEDDILCFLPTASDLDVFGCELDLLDPHTRQPLSESIPHGAPATTATTNCSSSPHGRRTFHLAVPGRRKGKLPPKLHGSQPTQVGKLLPKPFTLHPRSGT